MSALSRRAGPAPLTLSLAAGFGLPRDAERCLREGARVLEVGCGAGLGCVALAAVYPQVQVEGHDPDARAIARALSLAEGAGLSERVAFVVSDGGRLSRSAFALVAVTDLMQRREPARTLNAIRNALVPEGVCLLGEASRPRAPRYPSEASPTDDLARLAARAGFSRITPIASGGHHAYELRR